MINIGKKNLKISSITLFLLEKNPWSLGVTKPFKKIDVGINQFFSNLDFGSFSWFSWALFQGQIY